LKRVFILFPGPGYSTLLRFLFFFGWLEVPLFFPFRPLFGNEKKEYLDFPLSYVFSLGHLVLQQELTALFSLFSVRFPSFVS